MKKSINIAMLGGDRRQIACIERLSERYHNIKVFGISSNYIETLGGVCVCEKLEKCLEGADAVILPLPATLDGTSLNAPLGCDNEAIKLSTVIKAMPTSSTLIGGRLPQVFISAAEASGIRVIDYYRSEELQIKNAYTTAEAALSIAMNSLDKNIKGSKIAVTGYGRIAKQLSALLLSLGAKVTVAARDPNALVWAKLSGCDTLLIDSEKHSIFELKEGYDVIYNTVPFWLFKREFLLSLDKRTLIIDLASAPGGVDIKAAREFGSNVNWATSLPGKYAPRSAGEDIAECLDGIIKKEVGL